MKVSAIEFAPEYADVQAMRERLALNANPLSGQAFEMLRKATQRLPHLQTLDHRIKSGQDLTMHQALQGMAYVLAASNLPFREWSTKRITKVYQAISPESDQAYVARGIAFLQGMAMRESLAALTPAEIAGLAIGGLADCVVHLNLGEVIETCGMGGDRGFGNQHAKVKTINASTLSAVVLAAMELPAFKHGSGPTTAAMGSTEATQMLGIPTEFEDVAAMERYFAQHGFIYLNARLKTIHDLSTLTKLETVNHVVGPMSPPVSATTRIHKVIGVNNKVHPTSMVRAYNLLCRHGVQDVGGVIAVCGLSGSAMGVDTKDAYRYAILDEVSPYETLLAVGQGTEYFGSVMVSLEDFGDINLSEQDLALKNEAPVLQDANMAALKGENPQLADYLAVNATLGLVAFEGLDREFVTNDRIRRARLSHAFRRCRQAISSGRVAGFLHQCTTDSVPAEITGRET